MKRLLVLLLLLAPASLFAQQVTGSITATSAVCTNTSCVPFIVPATFAIGQVGGASIQLTGTWVATVTFEASADVNRVVGEPTWVAIGGYNTTTGATATTATANGVFQFAMTGLLGIRVRASAYTSGTVLVAITSSTASPFVSSLGGGGAASTVDITAVGGTAVTTTLPTNLLLVNGQGSGAFAGNGAVGSATIRVVQGSGSTVSSCADETQVLSVPISTAAAANTELVALTAAQTVFVCGYSFIAAGTVDVQLITGTGAACATGETDLTGPYSLVVNSGIAVPNGGAMQTKGLLSNALCIELSAAIQVSGMLSYVKRVP